MNFMWLMKTIEFDSPMYDKKIDRNYPAQRAFFLKHPYNECY